MPGHALNAALTSAMYQLTSEKRFHRPSRCHVGKAGEKGREGKRKGGERGKRENEKGERRRNDGKGKGEKHERKKREKEKERQKLEKIENRVRN